MTMPEVDGLKRQASFTAAVDKATRRTEFETSFNRASDEKYNVGDTAELSISVPDTGYDAECLVLWGRTTLQSQVRC